MIVREEEDITANVVRALELSSARKLLALRAIPRPFRGAVEEVSALAGSPFFTLLTSRTMQYWRFAVQKSAD